MVVLTGCCLLFAGCGAGEITSLEETAENYATDQVYYEESMSMETDAEAGNADAGNADVQVRQNRKLIRTVDMRVETEEYDTLLANVTERIYALGGYVENSDIGINDYLQESRYAKIKARIPKEHADSFIDDVAEHSNVISKSENIEDVTLQYVDIESHKKALEAEQERLLELMEQAESIEDIISIEGRLSEVRYQIESFTSQMRTYDNQVDYTTITISVEEVQTLTPVTEPGTWERISTGFMRSLHNVGKGIKNFLIEFVIAIPYLLVFAVIIIVVVLIMTKSAEKRRRMFAERRKKENLELQKQNGTESGSRKPDTGKVEDINGPEL